MTYCQAESHETPEPIQSVFAGRNDMIEANMPLVVHLARPYLGRGLSQSDLVQETHGKHFSRIKVRLQQLSFCSRLPRWKPWREQIPIWTNYKFLPSQDSTVDHLHVNIDPALTRVFPLEDCVFVQSKPFVCVPLHEFLYTTTVQAMLPNNFAEKASGFPAKSTENEQRNQSHDTLRPSPTHS